MTVASWDAKMAFVFAVVGCVMLVLQPPALREAADALYSQGAEANPPARRSRTLARSHTVAGTAVPHEGQSVARPGVPLEYEVPNCANLPAYAHRSADNESDLARVHAAMRQARRIAVVCGRSFGGWHLLTA